MRKIVFILFSFILTLQGAFAQTLYTLEGTAEVERAEFDANYQIKYKWVDGERVLHGPVKMFNYDRMEENVEDSYGRQGYNMTANHKNGALHGTLKMENKTDYYFWDDDGYNWIRMIDKSSSSFTGTFNEGVPNGTFKMSFSIYDSDQDVSYYRTEGEYRGNVPYSICSLTCSYKNGVLVGPFNLNLSARTSVKVTGSFTSDGNMTGKWVIDGETLQFLNGVFLKHEDYDQNLSSLASQYASKKLSLSKLESDYCVGVYEDPTAYSKIEELATITIKENGYIAWNMLGTVRFDASNKKCEILYYLPSLSDEGVKKLLDEISSIEYLKQNPESFFHAEDFACKYISIDSSDNLTSYCKNTESWGNYDKTHKVYLTDKQYNQIKDALTIKYDAYKLSQLKAQFEEIVGVESPSANTLGCPEDCLADYMPIVGFEYLDYKKTTSELIMHTKVNVANKSGVGYKTFNWDVYLNPTDYSINVEKTYDKTSRTQVPNEYDTINVVLDSLNTLSAQVLEAGKLAFPSSLQSYEAQLRDVMAVNHSDLSGTIVRMRNFVKSQPGAVAWIEMSSQVSAKERKILPSLVLFSDVKDSYETIKGGITLSWTPENDTTQLHNLSVVLDKALVFAQKRDTIKKNTESILANAPEFSNLKSAYQIFVSSSDLSMSTSIDYTVLDQVIALQNKTIPFIDVVVALEKKDKEVKSAAENHKDVLDAYSAYIAANDDFWPDMDQDKCTNISELQQKTLDFIGLRDIIAENEKKIREAATSSPAILNPYTEFFVKYDLSWTPEVDYEKLRKLISIQEETLTLIANNNKILENTRQIKEEGQSFEDFIAAYLSVVSADVVWTEDVDIESTEKTLDMQRKTLEYLALRKTIVDNDPQLKEMSSAGKVLYKLYATYRKTADLSWTPEVDMTSLDELYKIQEGCKEMLGYSDIKDICKSIKKAKIKDVKVAIEQFRK